MASPVFARPHALAKTLDAPSACFPVFPPWTAATGGKEGKKEGEGWIRKPVASNDQPRVDRLRQRPTVVAEWAHCGANRALCAIQAYGFTGAEKSISTSVSLALCWLGFQRLEFRCSWRARYHPTPNAGVV